MEIIYRTPRDHSLQHSHKGPSHTRILTVMCSLATIVQSYLQSTLSLGRATSTANGWPSVFLIVWLAKQPFILPPISVIDIYFCVGYTMRIIFPWTFLPLHASAYFANTHNQSLFTVNLGLYMVSYSNSMHIIPTVTRFLLWQKYFSELYWYGIHSGREEVALSI